jgi:adenylate cyclase
MVFSPVGVSKSIDWVARVKGNHELRSFLWKMPPVVLAASYGGYKFIDVLGVERARSLPLIARETRKLDDIEPPEVPAFETNPDPERPNLWSPNFVGLIDTFEGGTRMVPAFAPTATRTYFHLSVELARLYLGLPPGSIRIEKDHLAFVRPDGSVMTTIPLRDGQLLEVNWFSRWESTANPRESFAAVYQAADLLESDDLALRAEGKEFLERFKDSVVLIGPVDPLLQDLGAAPLDPFPVPKVGVHGNLLKTIISGKYLQHVEERVGYGIVFGLTLVVTVLALAGGARALVAKISALVAIGVYVVIAVQMFKLSHLVLPLAAPIGAALTTSFVGLIWQVIEEQKAKGRIKGMFGAYVSPQLVSRMVEAKEDPQLGGHEEEITAYFSDIQSFSSFSEVLPPAKLVELMNEYLTACTDIVQAQGGTLDKYIGDAVVAMFGAPLPLPDHAYRACVATQLVHQKLGELRAKWRGEGDKWPEIVWNMQSRIGLNSGLAVIGNMGSRTRFNYTMMGDNVNLAARMESGAKQYGVYTMIAEATKLACEKQGDRLVFRYLDKIVVKGRSIPVPIYEVVGLKETIAPQTAECLEVYGQGIARYLAQDWGGAEALFKRSAALEPNQPGKTPGVEGNPSLTLIKRCHVMREHPPGPGWKGDYVMKEK